MRQYEGNPLKIAAAKFYHQVAILASASTRLDSLLDDLTSVIRAEVFEQELDSARSLSKAKQLRAAGAVCGVVLEKHLALVCTNHGVSIKKRDPSISEYAAELKAAQVVDLQTWKLLDYLGGIRNLCCHHKGREPKAEEVDELLSGVDRIMRTVF